MRTSLKAALIILLLASIVGLVALMSRPRSNEPDPSGGPSFEVNVERPLGARPFFGLLPGSELRFDQKSPGAESVGVEPNRLDLRADGWSLLLETDGEGRVAPTTRVVFPIELGGRHVTLRCRPADRAAGYLRTTTRAGSDALDGRFLVECATCENAESGKAIEWPPAPLTVSGRFAGLPHGRS